VAHRLKHAHGRDALPIHVYGIVRAAVKL
jgi:hypothetical protein